MIIFATKPDRNGNIKKLIVDPDKKQFARECAGFFHRSDAVIVSPQSLKLLQKGFEEKHNYKEVNSL